MGRKRTKDKSLPPRFHTKGKACYHVANPVFDQKTKKNIRRWTPIGTTDNLPEALLKWSILENNSQDIAGNTVYALAEKYNLLIQNPTNPLNLGERTRSGFSLMLRAKPASTLLRAFGHVAMVDLKQHHIASYLDDHPHPVAANREIALLSRMFRYAIRKAWCTDNPCLGVEKNTEKSRDRYPEDWEYCAIRAFCWNFKNKLGQSPWRPLSIAMDISYLTSFRLSDVIQLQDADYDDSELRIREGKTGWKARVDMTPELWSVLDRAKDFRRRSSTFSVITNLEGKPYIDTGFKSAWQRMMRAALKKGIIKERFTFHDIRAKHATDKDEQDLNAQLALGHVTPRQTAAYIRSRKGRKIDALKTKIVEVVPSFVEDGKNEGS